MNTVDTALTALGALGVILLLNDRELARINVPNWAERFASLHLETNRLRFTIAWTGTAFTFMLPLLSIAILASLCINVISDSQLLEQVGWAGNLIELLLVMSVTLPHVRLLDKLSKEIEATPLPKTSFWAYFAGVAFYSSTLNFYSLIIVVLQLICLLFLTTNKVSEKTFALIDTLLFSSAFVLVISLIWQVN